MTEENAARNAKMQQQLAHSKLQRQVDEQGKEIKDLKAVVLKLNRAVTSLIRKLGP